MKKILYGHDVFEKIKLWQAILSGANKIHIPVGDSSPTNPVMQLSCLDNVNL